MLANVYIPIIEKNCVVIPRKSLIKEDGKNYVYMNVYVMVAVRFSLIDIEFFNMGLHGETKDPNVTYTKTIHYTVYNGICVSFYFPDERPFQTLARYMISEKVL